MPIYSMLASNWSRGDKDRISMETEFRSVVTLSQSSLCFFWSFSYLNFNHDDNDIG